MEDIIKSSNLWVTGEWNSLWKVIVLGKVKVLAWQMMRDAYQPELIYKSF